MRQRVPGGRPGRIGFDGSANITADGTRYRFARWSDGETGAYRTIAVRMDTVLNAESATEHYLTLQTEPSGIAGLVGEGWYKEGKEKEVAAPKIPHYRFDHWSVDGEVLTDPIITIRIENSRTATAHYTIDLTEIVDQLNYLRAMIDTLVAQGNRLGSTTRSLEEQLANQSAPECESLTHLGNNQFPSIKARGFQQHLRDGSRSCQEPDLKCHDGPLQPQQRMGKLETDVRWAFALGSIALVAVASLAIAIAARK